jgi:hypothetical protein
MWGDAAYGEIAYGEPQDNTIPAFQNRAVFAVIEITAVGAGGFIGPVPGFAEIEIIASGVGDYSRQRVRVIQTAPRSGRSRTGLSHTGLHNESV